MSNTDTTPADLNLLRLLPKRWPDRFVWHEQGGMLMVNGEDRICVYDRMGYIDGWEMHGPAILAHALQEVCRDEGWCLWCIPVGPMGSDNWKAGILALGNVAPGKTALSFRKFADNNANNPAIACLRAMAEMIEPHSPRFDN